MLHVYHSPVNMTFRGLKSNALESAALKSNALDSAALKSNTLESATFALNVDLFQSTLVSHDLPGLYETRPALQPLKLFGSHMKSSFYRVRISLPDN